METAPRLGKHVQTAACWVACSLTLHGGAGVAEHGLELGTGELDCRLLGFAGPLRRRLFLPLGRGRAFALGAHVRSQ